MAVQPFVSFIWGRPEIRIAFDVFELKDEYTILQVNIYNVPIVKGILHFLRITRNTAEGLTASYTINNVQNGDEIVFEWPSMFSGESAASQRVNLPAGSIPARFGIVTLKNDSGEVKPGIASPSVWVSKSVIPTGLYKVLIEVELAGRIVATSKKNFVVQSNKPFAYWVNY